MTTQSTQEQVEECIRNARLAVDMNDAARIVESGHALAEAIGQAWGNEDSYAEYRRGRDFRRFEVTERGEKVMYRVGGVYYNLLTINAQLSSGEAALIYLRFIHDAETIRHHTPGD